MIPAKEFEGELWIKAADHHQAMLEAAVKVAIEAEREACAKFVEDGYVRQFERPWREDLAAAIRARGQA